MSASATIDPLVVRTPHRERFVSTQARVNAARAEGAAQFGAAFVDLTRSEPIWAWLTRPPDPVAVWRTSRKYLANAGFAGVRELVARHYAAEFGVPLTSDHVLVAPGGQTALMTALAALAGPGDEVVVPAPYFPSYPALVELTGATPVLVAPTDEDDPRMNAPLLRASVGGRTRVAVLNNPVNPTGVVYDHGEVEKLLDCLPAEAAWLVDEVYADVIHGRRARPCAAAALWRRPDRPWLLLRSASKTIGRPGLRTAVLIGTPELISRVESLSSLIGGAANALGQAALAPALAEAARAPWSDAYERRLETAMRSMRGTALRPITPQGTYYLWVRGPEGAGIGTMDAVEDLCRETGVLVGAGEAYGNPNAIRLSISVPRSSLRVGIRRLAGRIERVAR